MLGVAVKNKKHKVIFLIFIVAILIIGFFLLWDRGGQDESIGNFEECITAGYPIMESYPRKCQDGEGKVHVEKIEYPFSPGT